jgi:glyoxylase-like metal-dependent hydrolase (beta-lactamase superfamily II)
MRGMERIADGIYALGGLKVGRAYLIEDHDGLTLIDTSSAGAAQRILDAITSIGRRPDELRTIVATHYHYDHTGNVAALVERTGATFCAHTIEAPYIDGRTPWMAARGVFGPLASALSPKPFALPVACELRTGETLDAGGGLDVIHAPGHTPGHIALHARARRVLFAGDSFMNPAGLFPPQAVSSHDMDEAKRTIARLAELDFDIALPGHGHPLIGRANEKLAEWSRRWLEA